MLRVWTVLLFSCCVATLGAQSTSSLDGTVFDAATEQVIAGARVDLILQDTTLSSTTDEAGHFHFAAVASGVHHVRAQRLGYQSTQLPEVWVRPGKAEQVEIPLSATAYELGTVEVQDIAPQRLSALGAHALTVEQSLRYPASFYDPARLAISRPGVAATNDQANHFSVRGNAPTGNTYLLEGAEIVNPNHLTNAGTASDQPTLSGGGVSILSAQLLGTSQFLVGAMDAARGNALGGIMDVHLRRGTAERQAFTAQAGLLGIDLSTEGPFQKDGRASYLINYRYSTIGLLSAMGVQLGDETIAFQDLSFHVSLPMKQGSISLFGMGGMSSNRHDALEDSTEWEYDKDSQNIDYTSSMGAVGGTLRLLLGTKAVWGTTIVISANEQERTADGIIMRRFSFTDRKYLYEQKLSVATHVRGSCSSRFSYQIGGSAMERTVEKSITFAEVVQGWLLRPYAQGSYAFTDRLNVEGGIAYAHYTFNSASVVEPRASIQLRTGSHGALSIAAGQRSQLPNVQLFPTQPLGSLWDNSRIGLTRSQDIVLGYDQRIAPHLVFHVEVFHQRQLDVPVADTNAYQFSPATGTSMVNAWDDELLSGLVQNGEAANQGIEISLQRSFHNGLFYQANATWIDATYADASGDNYNARWNTMVMGNLMVGREFAKQKERMKRTWGVSARANVTGGQRYTPSVAATGEDPEPYSAQLATYYRIDLRVYLKREHDRRTGMWALDIQNVTNAQNEAYRYFDWQQNEIVTKYQLGLIPNLSYRIEF